LGYILGLLESFLESGVLIPGLALSFGFLVAYLLISAKHYVPLTAEEVETLWKFHKQKTNCQAKKWREIKKTKKIVGFECECGHNHIQKKPIINFS
jgi:hypothetical protein